MRSNALPPGRVTLDGFFAGVDDLLDAPWYADGIHIALDPQWWTRAPVESVAVSTLRRTQRFVAKKHLGRCAANVDWPWVVVYRDQFWIIDGHHRAVTALLGGTHSIDAHIMRVASHDRAPSR